MAQDVMITGISGFLGSNLRRYLMENKRYQITGCSRELQTLDPIKDEIHNVCTFDDLFHPDNGNEFHTYIHLAGKVYNTADKSVDKDYFDSNYTLTKQIFDRFLQDKKAKKFIFMSTIHVLTENPKVKLDEAYEPKPFTPYGKSKYRAETYLMEHSRPGKQVFVLRPSMIHGPGSKGNLNALYKWVKTGLPYPFGAINNKRSFVSIDNLCYVIEQILSRDIPPGLYHIADDEPTRTHDLIRLIANEIGIRPRIWNINPRLLYMITKIGGMLSLPVNEYRYNKLVGDFVVSNQKIKSAIGSSFPVRSQDGLKKTIKSLKEQTNSR